jgi:hypothetical protein
MKIIASGEYCITGGQDRIPRLWNPHRIDEGDPTSGTLVKSYPGPHNYEIRDIAMYILCVFHW